MDGLSRGREPSPIPRISCSDRKFVAGVGPGGARKPPVGWRNRGQSISHSLLFFVLMASCLPGFEVQAIGSAAEAPGHLLAAAHGLRRRGPVEAYAGHRGVWGGLGEFGGFGGFVWGVWAALTPLGALTEFGGIWREVADR